MYPSQSSASYVRALARLAAQPDIPQSVPELLKNLHWRIQDVLSGNLVGIYVRGSLATGDFDARTSDVDFFVVTERRFSEAEFASVSAMHRQLAALSNPYAQHLEGVYIDRAAVKRFRAGEMHPSLYRMEPLIWCEHDYNWVLERWMVREHGIVLYGPEPDTVIDAVSVDELRHAVYLRLREWVNWSNQPDDPDWQLPRSHKAYVVETMCRALCTLFTGQLESKPRAVLWALDNVSDPWRTTVKKSQQWHTDATLDQDIVPEVRSFIHWTFSQACELYTGEENMECW